MKSKKLTAQAKKQTLVDDVVKAAYKVSEAQDTLTEVLAFSTLEKAVERLGSAPLLSTLP
jgi:hypothetical protein